eukprot:6007080-Amphidinium_carterae.1
MAIVEKVELGRMRGITSTQVHQHNDLHSEPCEDSTTSVLSCIWKATDIACDATSSRCWVVCWLSNRCLKFRLRVSKCSNRVVSGQQPLLRPLQPSASDPPSLPASSQDNEKGVNR